MNFYAYLPTGEITKIMMMSRESAELQLRGDEILGETDEYVDDTAHWVNGGTLALRPALTILTTEMVADGEERLVAADLPIPTVMRVDSDHPVEILDGELTWVPTEPGRWRVRLEPPFPWREHDFEVVVHEIRAD